MRKVALFAIAFAVMIAAGFAEEASRGEMNKEVVRKMTDAINGRDLDALDRLIAPDMVRHSAATAGISVESLEQFKDFLRQDFAAVPDSRMEILEMLGEDDLVAVRMEYRGTQKGNWGPLPPSGKTVEMPFLGILRFEDGKIAEMWVEWDNLNALTQLGHFPPPDAEGGSTDVVD